jgi:hypothetical protein
VERNPKCKKEITQRVKVLPSLKKNQLLHQESTYFGIRQVSVSCFLPSDTRKETTGKLDAETSENSFLKGQVFQPIYQHQKE